MIGRSYGIAFDIQGTLSIEDVKRELHKILSILYGNYYNKDWSHNRIKLEVTTRNVFLENDDLTRNLFNEEIVPLEINLLKYFSPSLIFAFYIDDSTGGRGFSLLNTNMLEKRIWIDSEFDKYRDSGLKTVEESFVPELQDKTEFDGDREIKIYSHKDFKDPIYGRRGIIEQVMRRILANRFMFDYEWQEYASEIKLLASDDFPIQDLQLLFGD